MAASFGFSLISSGFVILSSRRRENSSGACIALLSEREREISFAHQFSLTCYFSPTLSVTHTHTHGQTTVIVRFSGILEGSCFCVFITAGSIASSVADSQLQGPSSILSSSYCLCRLFHVLPLSTGVSSSFPLSSNLAKMHSKVY